MPPSPPRRPWFQFSELRRRKVFRVAAAYAVAAWIVVQVAARLPDAYVSPSFVATAHAELGRTEQALTWLERAVAAHDADLVLILGSDPAFDALRAAPRFRALRARVGRA